tara:strand:+ start:245 stop:487 length:243 start_codon:yes stop_codon:yes gene_type:complete
MVTTILPDGRLKHVLDNWTGFQNPNEPITKTKWYRDDMEYHEIQGSNTTYIVTRDKMGKINCECKGFQFRKKCKHVLEIL